MRAAWKGLKAAGTDLWSFNLNGFAGGCEAGHDKE